ncbi:hemerythrin domain-containing protein [Paenibacillus sp. P25]|nr:hemerythrin domain-containing protein [Paenibacillus sp. P25]
MEALAYLTTGCAEPEFERRLYELSTAVTGLAKALEAHSAWEDEAFFPMLSRCLDIPNQPTLATTLWMLEKEHALTFAFFRSFFEQAAAGGGQRSFVARGGAKDQLILACRLVRGHLSMEEAAIVPLTEPFCGSICDCFHIHDNGLEVY